MKVLVACEFSGVVRDAFTALGHNAWSCDLDPCERGGQHMQRDVREVLRDGWDLMIAHPPCTYLSRAGVCWLDKQPGRRQKREEAMAFFMELWNAPIPRVAIENPEGYARHAFRAPDQVINPYEFGHTERKKTLLWLRNLPPLFATCISPPATPRRDRNGKLRHWVDSLPSGGKERSRTFNGIARAMAEQWGGPATVEIAA